METGVAFLILYLMTIPEYLTLKQWLQLQMLTDIEDETDKIIYTISCVTEIPMEQLEENYPLKDLQQIYKQVLELLDKTKPEFYPVISWNNKEYGYRTMSKMNVAEYSDIVKLVENTQQNLTNIMALLYRPIVENKVKSTKYLVKNTIKTIQYEVENVFDYYTIEPYDAVKRKQQADEYLNFPAEIALGGLNFFMLTNLTSSKNTQLSFHEQVKNQVKEMKWKKKLKLVLVSIMAGYTQCINWLIPRSYKSQETKQ